MHSHERTMLAKLGFADPDRREPLHDLACQYLATPDAVRRLIRCLEIEHGPRLIEWNSETEAEASIKASTVVNNRVQHEFEIAKGYGRYRTTVGFVDLMVDLLVKQQHSNIKRRRRRFSGGFGAGVWSDWQAIDDYEFRDRVSFGVEVKISPAPLGDVIRQVRLYRSYSCVKDWVVVTAYALTVPQVRSLNNERIRHVRLGQRFHDYLASQDVSKEASSVEI